MTPLAPPLNAHDTDDLLARKDALVVIQDIYAGDGLRGVPPGTVKALRIFTYNFAYQEMGGLLGVVGAGMIMTGTAYYRDRRERRLAQK